MIELSDASFLSVAEMLAVLKTLPERDRLDVLAVLIRAALDSGIVQ